MKNKIGITIAILLVFILMQSIVSMDLERDIAKIVYYDLSDALIHKEHYKVLELRKCPPVNEYRDVLLHEQKAMDDEQAGKQFLKKFDTLYNPVNYNISRFFAATTVVTGGMFVTNCLLNRDPQLVVTTGKRFIISLAAFLRWNYQAQADFQRSYGNVLEYAGM